MTPHPALSPAAARRVMLDRMLRGEAGATAGMAPVAPRDPARPVALTNEQRQVWLHMAMAPDMPLYNESITIHRIGAYNHAALEWALGEVVRRHAIWRTAFVEHGGEPVQQVAEPRPIRLPIIDISHLPEAARDGEAVRLATQDARTAIALDCAPLFRARVVKLAEHEHRLYLTLHHIIFDGVSIYRTLVPELAALVAAFEAGQPSPLPEPALQYADYAVWQADHDDDREQQIAWWRQTLAEPLPRLELAGDRPRPAHATHAGSMETFELPPGLVERLKHIATAHGATLYMVLLAAFKTMLFRYTGERDIIVGGVTDTRRRPELQPLMGYFLNTMALRSRPQGDMAFNTYLAQVRASVIGALGACDVPFNRLVRALDIKRGAGTHPLFNTLFSIEPPVEPFPPGWDLTQMDVTVGAAKYDLYCELDERHERHGGGMVGRLLYSTELFDAETMRRMIDHFARLLQGVADDPSAPLAALPMLGPHEQRNLRHDWNDTAQPLPHASVTDWFAQTAARRPDATALVQGDVRWTYADLSRRGDAIAARLVTDGVRPGDLVGISLARTPHMVAALLGVLRAGAAYLPLDPGFPPARLTLIARDAGLSLALTDPDPAPGLVRALDAADVRLVPLLPDWPDAPAPRVPASDAAECAYVLYTSGSTGQPKGVEVSHGALVNLLCAMRDRPGFAPGESLLAITTLSFDIAGLELWLPLVCGGTVHIAPREVAIDMIALAETIDRIRPDVLQATPATWLGLIEAGWEGLGTLRALCGGEALPRVLAEQLLARVGALWNVYGPTETTIWSTCARVEHGTGPVPIGRPIANTVVRVLDQAGQDRPIGAVGELWIGGCGVAIGYRGRPDLTAERFVAIDGVRMYRTGDLARWRADGQLVCLGRVDSEEKIRGFRVAIEEIEGALIRLPRIAAAAVRAWPDASGERALAAYVVGQGEPAEWRAQLAETLPDYMIPGRFVVLDALPLTPNGKLDRQALPPPDAPVARRGEPPATLDEARLAAIWCKVLQLETVGRDDDFFDLGGHSLLIARLLRLAEAEFGHRVPMATLFRAPRLADMAALIASGKPIDSPALVPIQPKGTQPPIFWLDGGSTMLPLAHELGEDQPFFGISVDALLDAIGRCPKRLDDIAALVVEEVLRLRPQGPYRLGGWCSSGIIAYAVASQLVARGAQVELLILAHAFHPVKARSIGALRFFTSRLRFHVAQTMRQQKGRQWHYFRDRLRGLSDSAGLVGGREAVLRPDLIAAINRAALHYVPPAYPGHVLLLQPAEHPDVLDFEAEWRADVTGRFEIHTAHGGHRTMLEHPNVVPLAARVASALDARRDGRRED
jgi:amino acid adenylation domain-containing protein